jgi:hypothetical protein
MIRHSRRIDPINLSTYGFCQGDLGAISTSSTPRLPTHLVHAGLMPARQDLDLQGEPGSQEAVDEGRGNS